MAMSTGRGPGPTREVPRRSPLDNPGLIGWNEIAASAHARKVLVRPRLLMCRSGRVSHVPVPRSRARPRV
jgi:hypothetical protein